MPATIHNFPALPERDDCQRQAWRAKCRQCQFEIECETGVGAESRARAHVLVQGHDVAISFSLYDVPAGVIRAEETRR